MIEYKLDKKPTMSANTAMKDMHGVLKEVAVTYRLLLETIDEQEASLSLSGINEFRNELRLLVKDGISLAETVTKHSEKLVIVSEQAAKHLVAFEKHFNEALQKHTQKVEVS